MKIKYTQKNKFYYEGTLNGDLIAVITCVIFEGVEQISIMDYQTKKFLNTGDTLSSINQAKAAVEYHFRDLIESAE